MDLRRWRALGKALVLLLLVAAVTSSCSNDRGAQDPSSGPIDGTTVEGPTTSSSLDRADHEVSGDPAIPNDVAALSPEDCRSFKAIIEAGPARPIVPGGMTEEAVQEVLVELEVAIEGSPPETRGAMGAFADSYREVLALMGSLDGDLSDPSDQDRALLRQISEAMSRPEVIEATAKIEAWNQQC